MAEEHLPQVDASLNSAIPPPSPVPDAPDRSPTPGTEKPDSHSSREEAERQSVANKVKAQFGDTTAHTVAVGENVSVHENYYKVFIPEAGEEFSIRAFSAEYCTEITPQREIDLNEVFIQDEWLTAALVDHLKASRVIILSGPPEIGKKMLALHLAYLVRHGKEQPGRETFLVKPFQRRVNLKLQTVAADEKDFGRRVIIFPQSETDDNDLLEVFGRLKEFELEEIVRALEKNDSYFLYTVDAPQIKPFRDDLKSLGVMHEIPPPSRQMLEMAIEKRVTRLLKGKNVTAEQAEAAQVFVSEEKHQLIERLPRMSRLALLIDRYLLDIVDENNQLDLLAAIDLVESPEKWFLRDLGRDFEAWCFVFTLGLCQCGPEIAGVPWLEFDSIRQAISKCLSRELRMWRREQVQPSLPELLDEHALLEKCRAQIVREAGTGDLVRFVDASYPTKLWRVFTDSNRRILTLILPVLRDLARSNDTQIRACAARALGRMGELNPPHIAIAAISEWIDAKPLRQKAAVGYLYEGILASADESYRQVCRTELQHLSLSKGDELWTAIAVYKQIGRSGGENLTFAISKLGEITERTFAEWLVWEKEIEKELENYEKRNQKNLLELFVAEINEQTLKDLRKIMREVFDEDGRIMLAICYSLVALILEVGAFAVIVELNKWFQQGRKSLACLTSWIFWMEEGIADRLASYRVSVPNPSALNGEVYDCLPVVAALGFAMQNESQVIRKTTHFLTATYSHFSTFSPRMRQLLKRKFLLHLKQWADNAWAVKEYREVVKELYLELLISSGGDLAQNLRQYITNDKEFCNKAHLKRFAEMVLECQEKRVLEKKLLG